LSAGEPRLPKPYEERHPRSDSIVSLARIQEAAALLEGKIIRTPLVYSPTFSEMTGAEVYLKLECMQKAGSFKVRGAANRILAAGSAIGKDGVIAASAGNHAQGVAVAARSAGVPATIVMPEWVSPSKQEAAAGYGAAIILKGSTLQESIGHARELAASGHLTFIHPYNDEAVIAGQGTIGLELLGDLPDVDTVVVPIGGGGLIAGVAVAVKGIRPETRIIGVQAAACPSARNAFQSGKPVTISSGPTIADGIRVTRIGELAFPVLKDRVDGVVEVEEQEIVHAMYALLERKKVLAEGAGAAPLAALLSGKIPTEPRERVVVIISGGNIDPFLFERIFRKGLFDAGKIQEWSFELEEGPQSLPMLLTLIAREGGTITRIEQERGSSQLPPHLVRVVLEIETRGPEHRERILSKLQNAGYSVRTR
jgi:threonine dehydratase